MKTKIIVVVIAFVLLGISAPMAISETVAVSGTFTPQSSIDISTNSSTIAYGDVALNSNTTQKINVTNDGTAYCQVTTIAEDGTQDWGLVAGTSSPTNLNEYCVNMNNGTNFGDANASSFTVNASMTPTGVAGNFTVCSVFLLVGTKTDVAEAEMTFFLNMTAAAAS